MTHCERDDNFEFDSSTAKIGSITGTASCCRSCRERDLVGVAGVRTMRGDKRVGSTNDRCFFNFGGATIKSILSR